MLIGDKENLAADSVPHCTLRQFLNTSTGHCVNVDVPELRDHGVLRSSAAGLLVLFKKDTGAVILLNPITRQAAQLPPFTAMLEDGFLPSYVGNYMPSIVGLVDDDRTIVLRYFSRSSIGTLAFAKPGDNHWTLFSNINDRVTPSTLCAGHLYGVSYSYHTVMALETTGGGDNGMQPRLVPVADLTVPLIPMTDTVHLVDNGGELMLVHRMLRVRVHPDTKQQSEFKRNHKRSYKVYRVNMEKRKLTRARGLGGRAVFIGRYNAISVSPKVFPSLDGNTVYPSLACHERGGDEQVGAYHLRDESTESFNFDRNINFSYIGNYYKPSTVGLVDDDRTIMLRYFSSSSIGTLAFANQDDNHETLFRNINDRVTPSTLCVSRFYGVSYSYHAVMALETGAAGIINGDGGGRMRQQPRMVPVVELTVPLIPMKGSVHLVDNGGDLMLMHRLLHVRVHPDTKQQIEFRRTHKRSYKAYRVNMEKRKLTRACGLGGRAVFVGRYNAIFVSPPQVFHSVDGNTVYPGLAFHERGGDEQVGTYHLRDGSTESFNLDRNSGPTHPWSLADCLAAYASG
ncbi:hypothetical protein PR202_ga06594 [Eleusine coracana subsp. coracana]|uniref:KIB1-4 beta-propeller domain-containing protein n=1 Tax=Eleusine coracana subsp. coracana TaxID=191504 RepID=A0AAV5BXV7_ELECO|nr:hypothetical protein PR202_ga06594 [Eleusine coracana subsp. coracana]